MVRRILPLIIFCTVTFPLTAQDGGVPPLQPRKLPAGVILLKGAVPSASDSKTPLPESGVVNQSDYDNAYFGLSYALPAGWFEKYKGPPPSDSGAYLLTLLRPGPAYKGTSKATLLITAQDMFFSLTPAANAAELIEQTKSSLQAEYKVERLPEPVTIAGHSFTRFDYTSPSAQLHWYVLATEIRCHAIKFVFTSADPSLLETLIKEMSGMKLPDGDSPQCVAHYAEGANVTYKVDPVLTERTFNAIPVRIIIDGSGKVRHVHVISAFPEQARIITDALLQWRFKPYVRDGQGVEVETGILFGMSRSPAKPTVAASSGATKAASN
jgi:hypothetical protein